MGGATVSLTAGPRRGSIAEGVWLFPRMFRDELLVTGSRGDDHGGTRGVALVCQE